MNLETLHSLIQNNEGLIAFLREVGLLKKPPNANTVILPISKNITKIGL